jgi:hypothetical protein
MQNMAHTGLQNKRRKGRENVRLKTARASLRLTMSVIQPRSRSHLEGAIRALSAGRSLQ